jgi:hypothetical protein
MVIVLPFHSQALPQAELWMQWVKELGCGRNHSIILLHGKTCDFSRVEALARESFASVELLPDAEDIKGHPEGPNSMMRQAVWHCQTSSIGPWMFCEPDNIALLADTFDRYEREYKGCGKDFMGSFRPAHDVTPDYLSGNMMLPKEALFKAPMLSRRGLSRDGVELAFDIVAASQILPLAHFTKLQQQVPKNSDGTSISFPDSASLSLLSPDAVFFHPCKDGSLIERLRERGRNGYEKAPIVTISGSPGTAGMASAEQTVAFSEYLAIVKERDELLREISALKSSIGPVTVNYNSPPADNTPRKKRRVKRKLKRTTEEQAKINARMAKARAGKGLK